MTVENFNNSWNMVHLKYCFTCRRHRMTCAYASWYMLLQGLESVKCQPDSVLAHNHLPHGLCLPIKRNVCYHQPGIKQDSISLKPFLFSLTHTHTQRPTHTIGKAENESNLQLTYPKTGMHQERKEESFHYSCRWWECGRSGPPVRVEGGDSLC